MKRNILLLVIVLVILVFQGCRGDVPSPAAPSNTPAAIIEQQTQTSEEKTEKPMAPDIAFLDTEGNQLMLSDFKGKVIFLNFWGTWCPPCRGEMPDLEKVYKEYKDKNVQILAANVQGERGEKDMDGVKEWFEKNGYTMPLVFVTQSDAATIYGLNAFPTSVFINPEGRVEFYQRGAITEEQMKYALDLILNQGE